MFPHFCLYLANSQSCEQTFVFSIHVPRQEFRSSGGRSGFRGRCTLSIQRHHHSTTVLRVSSSSYPFSDPPVQTLTSSLRRATVCSCYAASSCLHPAGTAASAFACAASGSAPLSSAPCGFCGRRASAAAPQASEGSGCWG